MKTIPFSLIVKDSLDAIAILDQQLEIINFSNSFMEQYIESVTQIEGQAFLRILPNVNEEVKKTLLSCLEGISVSDPETKFVLPNGCTQWTKWKLQPIKDSMGRIKGVMVILEDISETKKYNDLLLRAELVSRTGS